MPGNVSPVWSTVTLVAAYTVFLLSYLVFALGKFPGMKIDRTGAAIIGAVLMVAFRAVPAAQALRFIDFPTIVLLFSMMLLVAYLHVAGFFDWVADLVVRQLAPRSPVARHNFHQRAALRVFRQRRHLPRDGSFCVDRDAAHGFAPGALLARRSHGLQHRQRRHHHRQSPKYSHRIAFRHPLYVLSRAPGTHRARGPLRGLAGDLAAGHALLPYTKNDTRDDTTGWIPGRAPCAHRHGAADHQTGQRATPPKRRSRRQIGRQICRTICRTPHLLIRRRPHGSPAKS